MAPVLLRLSGRLPGLNEYIAAERRNKYMAAKMKRDAQNFVSACAKAQRLPRIKNPVVMEYHYYEPNRRRDHDNVAGFAHKVIQDALVEIGVLKDDGWDEIVGFIDSFSVDKKDPRIEVEIREVLNG